MESIAGQGILRELAEWHPEGGVVSVYVQIDPGDRSEGWRIKLRHAVEDLEPEARGRVFAHFPDEQSLSHGRAQVGFIELGGRQREIWHSFQLDLPKTSATQSPNPCLAPLVELLDDGWPIGVVVITLEIVRVLETAMGETSELDGWELEITSLDWRERKARSRSADVGTGASASGRDQYRQRLDHNRARFLKEAGELIASRYGDRDWRNVVLIGETDRPQLLAKGLGPLAERVHEINQDLVGAPLPELEARIAEEIEHLNRSREERLVARLREAIGSTPGAALGPEAVLESAREGRVHQVLIDAQRDWEQRDGVTLDEVLIDAALATAAQVTPVEGLAASALAEHGGVAAFLRY